MTCSIQEKFFEVAPYPALILRRESYGSFLMVDANNNFYTTTGSTKEKVIGKNFFHSYSRHPFHLKRSFSSVHEILEKVWISGEKKQIPNIRFDIPFREGNHLEERHWKVEFHPVISKTGETEAIFLTAQDITRQVFLAEEERKKNDELIKSQQQYKDFLQENLEGLFSLDRDGNFTSVNKSQAELAELDQEELVGKNFSHFSAKKHREKINKFFQQALQGISSKFTAAFISAKGREMMLEISLLPLRMGEEINGAYGAAKLFGAGKKEKVVVDKKKFLHLHADFVNALIKDQFNFDVLQEVFGNIGQALGVDRMYLFTTSQKNDSGENLISQKVEWVSNNATPQIDNPDLQNMPESKLVEIMGPLTKNLPFTAVRSELNQGEMKEIFIDEGIKSMLLLPIFIKNKMYGFIGFDDCTTERFWNEDEILFLQTLAKNLSNTIEKRDAESKALKKDREFRESEKKFKALVQEGSDLMAILDTDGNYTFISDTVKTILGTDPTQILGKNVFEFIHPEDMEKILENFETLKVQKRVKTEPFRYKDGNGNWHWLETTAINMINDPAINGIITNSRDITTLLQQAKEIENINERYRLAATATNDLIYDWDLETDKIIRFHRSFEDLFGYTEDEMARKEFWMEQIHPEDLVMDTKKLYKTLEDPKENFINSEYRFKRADGTYARVIDKGYIIRDQEGKAIRLIGATSDISELTAKEEELKVANRRFRLAMKATNEMIWDWDIESDRVERSDAFHENLGYDISEMTSVNSFWRTIIHPGDVNRVLTSLEDALVNKHQDKWQAEYRITKKDKGVSFIYDRGFIVRDNSGKALQMVGAVLDVTESRRLLREIKNQNEILKEIAWEQSHLVRAPLARLKGLMSLLTEEKENAEMGKQEILSHMNESANELDGIIKSIVNRTAKIEERT